MMMGVIFEGMQRKSTRKDVTPFTQFLAKVKIVCDNMHMTGHTDKWCKANCDPHLFKELDNVSFIHCCLGECQVCLRQHPKIYGVYVFTLYRLTQKCVHSVFPGFHDT